MGLRTVFKTAGHWLKGLIVKVDSEIQFDTTGSPEIDSTGGIFIWQVITGSNPSWKLRDSTKGQDIILVDSLGDIITINPLYQVAINLTKDATAVITASCNATNIYVLTGTTPAVSLSATGVVNGSIIKIKSRTASGATTVTPASGTVDGGATYTIAQNDYAEFVWHDANTDWIVISK